jgi:hypothetical protein
MMDAYSYLSVLLSIVLGLAITQLLSGFAAMVRARGRMTMYWPVPVQMAAVFLISVQTWWALFALHARERWTFASFLVVLMQPVMLYLMAAFITPDLSGDARVDLRESYFRESRWFFGAAVIAVAISLLKTLVLIGRLPERADLIGHLVFIAGGLAGLFSRNEIVHKALAPLTLLFYSAYIALLFVSLPQ